MSKKTLSQELIKAVKEALHGKRRGKTVRPKVNIASVRKKLHMAQKGFLKNSALNYNYN